LKKIKIKHSQLFELIQGYVSTEKTTLFNLEFDADFEYEIYFEKYDGQVNGFIYSCL
jgi:hypothetical protein